MFENEGRLNSNFFDRLTETVQQSGPVEAAKFLVDSMRSQQRYTELFEALKMYHRMELGLPAVQTDLAGANSKIGGISEALQDKLDKRLIGDRVAAAEAMKDVAVNQDNLDTVLGLLVHEAVDVKRGTQLSLEMRGTCNTITMLDSVVSMRGRDDQQLAVGVLVEHVHQELLNSLRSDLARRENWAEAHLESNEQSVEKLLGSRPGLLKDGTYHLDTTHLASTVRFARILDDKKQLRLALDLAQYGRQLHPQYQYPSEEPFADLYPMSIAWFRAILGEHVDAATKLFLQKTESIDPQEHGTIAIETYADLLTRVGKPEEAMRFLIKRMPKGMRPFGIAPSLIELAEASGCYELML